VVRSYLGGPAAHHRWERCGPLAPRATAVCTVAGSVCQSLTLQRDGDAEERAAAVPARDRARHWLCVRGGFDGDGDPPSWPCRPRSNRHPRGLQRKSKQLGGLAGVRASHEGILPARLTPSPLVRWGSWPSCVVMSGVQDYDPVRYHRHANRVYRVCFPPSYRRMAAKPLRLASSP
jgi:hypothetical protein